MLTLVHDVSIYKPHVQWYLIVIVQVCHQRLIVLQNAGTDFLSCVVRLHRGCQEVQDVPKVSCIGYLRSECRTAADFIVEINSGAYGKEAEFIFFILYVVPVVDVIHPHRYVGPKDIYAFRMGIFIPRSKSNAQFTFSHIVLIVCIVPVGP